MEKLDEYLKIGYAARFVGISQKRSQSGADGNTLGSLRTPESRPQARGISV